MDRTTTRPKLLDLCCGAGGCAVGYHRAGFDVVGVDLHPQPRYPYPFIQGDVVAVMQALLQCCGLEDSSGRVLLLSDFAAIHASPPCQRYTIGRHIHQSGDRHPDLVGPCRELLERTGLPWVIENVMGAPLRDPAILCGTMFGLKVIRHRQFEASFLLLSPPHQSHPKATSPVRARATAPARTGTSRSPGTTSCGPPERWQWESTG
jgi:DNA (cytosine-5)-methyltransferase 1